MYNCPEGAGIVASGGTKGIMSYEMMVQTSASSSIAFTRFSNAPGLEGFHEYLTRYASVLVNLMSTLATCLHRKDKFSAIIVRLDGSPSMAPATPDDIYEFHWSHEAASH
jgi:hypothetical protein